MCDFLRTPASAAMAFVPEGLGFKAYGLNPYIDTEADHLSTFGLEVDIGCYSSDILYPGRIY